MSDANMCFIVFVSFIIGKQHKQFKIVKYFIFETLVVVSTVLTAVKVKLTATVVSGKLFISSWL